MSFQPDTATVVAARAGDPTAIDRLVAGYLPLVYTIVGRALDGHADVDDVVQETMIRVLRNLGDLREPESFRSWLVAITVRQVRERYRARQGAPAPLVPEDLRDPGADFTDLAITRLELSGQRKETADATRWLDEDNRELLSLWWLEASGELTRDEIVAAIDVTRQHAAVRIQRMKAQLETARVVVRVLAATPPCSDLLLITSDWDGRPGPLWRKRVARHTRDCRQCSPAWSGLVAAERLLVGMALVPLPPSLLAGTAGGVGGVVGGAGAAGHTVAGHSLAAQSAAAQSAAGHSMIGQQVAAGHHVMSSAAHHVVVKGAAKGLLGMTKSAVTAALTAGAVAVGGVGVVVYRADDDTPARAAVTATSAPAVPVAVLPSATSVAPSPSVSTSPSAKPSRSPSRKPKAPPATVAPAADSPKKGVSTWEFPGLKQAVGDVGAGWYYNWSANNSSMPAPSGVEFVPMIWGADNVTTATLGQARSEGDVLLGFNEPDLGEQSNMTPEKALELWPKLQATGMRLGSPSVAFGGDTDGGWLDRFMSGAEARGLRVDFITLHWYGSDFSAAAVGHLKNYLEAVHKKYGKPIWLTEYGLMNFSGSPKYPGDAQKAAFISGSTAMMEALPYVERYAWFSLPAVGDSADYGLYRDGDTPTAAGQAYRAAGD